MVAILLSICEVFESSGMVLFVVSSITYSLERRERSHVPRFSKKGIVTGQSYSTCVYDNLNVRLDGTNKTYEYDSFGHREITIPKMESYC